MFRISQQIRYDYNRLVKDEKARKEFGMPLLEPKVEEVVPDISKETWRPQARHNRERHWSSRSSRGRGSNNRGGSRSGRGMPRGGGGGGGYRNYDRSQGSSRYVIINLLHGKASKAGRELNSLKFLRQVNQ